MDIETAAARLAALGNPTRLRIYRLLVTAGDGGLAMGHLGDRLGVPGSTLSHH
ncbi:MAG: helix-turn-helix domain-containing protein, partial [Rhodobacterales bacterium]|nr:helix-turn-helix domain-containing protein [Rhodobacterales bacterium]MDX5499535.1 helix-turn-helix domain-containing protein [Rhodobacterales bacterium]